MRTEPKHFENKAAAKLKWLQLTREYCDLPEEATPLHYFIFHTLLEWSDNPDGPTKCWLSQEHLGHLCGRKSRRTITRYIADLEQWQAISVRSRFNDSNVMVINWQNLPGGNTVVEEMKRYRNAGSETSIGTLQVETCPVVRQQTSHYEAVAAITSPVVRQIGFSGSETQAFSGSETSGAKHSETTDVSLRFLKENPESLLNCCQANDDDVFLIWDSWNSEMTKIDVGRVIPIPSRNPSTNATFKKIATWIKYTGPDWQQHWKRIQTEITGNKVFSEGINNWHPSLDWMFSVSKNVMDDGQLNIDTILNGKYNHLKNQITWGLNENGKATETKLEEYRKGMKGMAMLGEIEQPDGEASPDAPC